MKPPKYGFIIGVIGWFYYYEVEPPQKLQMGRIIVK